MNRAARAHAAPVLDEDGAALGRCRYGGPDELPAIERRREYGKDPPARPDWRVTCVFVGRGHRGRGVAPAAVTGAVEQIAEVTDGRDAPGGVLLVGPGRTG